MNCVDAAYHTVHQYPGGAESLAPRLGKSPKVLCNKVNPNSPHQLTLAEAVDLQTITGDHRILEAMAHSMGYVLVQLVQVGECDNDELLLHMNRLFGEVGGLAQDVNQAIADGQVTAAELRQLHARGLRVFTELQQVLNVLMVVYGNHRS